MRALLLLAAVPLAACTDRGPATGSPIQGGRVATATLMTSAGQPAGRGTAREVAGGIRVTADVRAMPAGTHGIHIHTTGRCDAPGFETAGAHWNPATTKHGSMNPQGPHAGDMPNITVGNDGRGTVGVTLAGATMDGLLDADGAALIVHAGADDLMTDPSGNSGGRVACGVFAAG